MKEGIHRAQKRIDEALDTEESKKEAQRAIEMHLPKEIQLKTGEMFKAGAVKASEAKNKGQGAGSKNEHKEAESNQWESFETQVEMTRQGNKEAELRTRAHRDTLRGRWRCIPGPPG